MDTNTLDWELYWQYHSDLRDKLKCKDEVLNHYQKYGIHENRVCNIDDLIGQIKIALCIHIGNIDVFRNMKIHITQMLIQIPTMYVYISIIDSIDISDEDILDMLNFKDTSRLKIIRIPNRGMDIGGFLSCLSDIKESKATYDLYIKIHTKTDSTWRNQLLKPFRNLKNIIRTMYIEKNVGIIGAEEYLLSLSGNRLTYNKYHLNRLMYRLGINQELQDTNLFIGGTIFICSKHVLKRLFRYNINSLLKDLNDENSFDASWFAINNPDLQISPDESIKYWNTNGKYENRSPNLLHKIKHPNTISNHIRDGMIEHAYERLFGILCLDTGLRVIGYTSINYMDKYNIKFIPLVFPQFHQIPENDRFWGDGFTEWTLLKKVPKIVCNEEIKLPHQYIGYYNLLDFDHRKKMRLMAEQYHIYGFCYYHYWLDGHKVMYKPTELMLEDGEPHMPFFFSWANESWTRRWDGGNNEILLQQSYGPIENNIKHFEYLLTFFKHPLYIKIDNRPIFAIYRMEDNDNIRNEIKTIMETWNNLAKQSGFNGLFFIQTLGPFKSCNQVLPNIDAIFNFEPLYTTTLGKDIMFKDPTNSIFEIEDGVPKYDENIYLKNNPDVAMAVKTRSIPDGYFHYKCISENERYARTNKFKLNDCEIICREISNLKRIHKVHFRGAFVGWNNTPRRRYTGDDYSKYPYIFKKMTPDLFERHLIDIIRQIIDDPNTNENFIIINAWNEWNEQAVLEPNHIDNFAYLEVVKRVYEYFS